MGGYDLKRSKANLKETLGHFMNVSNGSIKMKWDNTLQGFKLVDKEDDFNRVIVLIDENTNGIVRDDNVIKVNPRSVREYYKIKDAFQNGFSFSATNRQNVTDRKDWEYFKYDLYNQMAKSSEQYKNRVMNNRVKKIIAKEKGYSISDKKKYFKSRVNDQKLTAGQRRYAISWLNRN